MLRDNFPRGAGVLRQQRVGKRHHPHRSVFLRRAQSLGEAKQRTGEPPFDTVDRKALDAASELGVALREDLEQRHRKAMELFHCSQNLFQRNRGERCGIVGYPVGND
jgi:hypothetical protein